MNPTTNAEAREFYKKKFKEGSWRWAAFIAIYFVSAISSLYLPKWLGVPMSNPGAEPPWYFIRSDFFTGMGHLAGALLFLAILALTWRRYPFTNLMLLMFVAIWMVPGITTAILIYWRCEHFFDYPNAVSAWPTFQAYYQSGIKFIGIPIGFAIAIALVGPAAWKRLRELRKA